MKSLTKDRDNNIDSESEKLSVGNSKEQTTATQLLGTRLQNSTAEKEKEIQRTTSYKPLKESIGHTEVEVIAGAIFGFLVTLTVNAIM